MDDTSRSLVGLRRSFVIKCVIMAEEIETPINVKGKKFTAKITEPGRYKLVCEVPGKPPIEKYFAWNGIKKKIEIDLAEVPEKKVEEVQAPEVDKPEEVPLVKLGHTEGLGGYYIQEDKAA